MQQVNDKAAMELIANSSKLIIQFGADWCGPCRVLKPQVDAISENFSGVSFAYVNIDDAPEISQKFGIMSIPTVIGFKDGNPVSQVVGSSFSSVTNLIKKIEEM
jgi:thioredoxin 1